MSPDSIAGIFSSSLGPNAVVSHDLMDRYLVDQRELIRGRAAAVVRPSNVAEVQAVMRLSQQHGFSVVPQAGNTSYCGGATPDGSGRQVILSLERLNRVRAIDARGYTMSLDAGVVLADAQAAAEKVGLLLGLGLGSEGSCLVGGNVGTNAGGLSVLRYGMTRELVLGLEIVLPDGRLLDDMYCLRKNNTGYDLKQLFIGSEGTIGIVTGVVFKLHPAPVAHATGWVAVPVPLRLVDALSIIRRETADLVSSFEYVSATSLSLLADLASTNNLPLGLGGAVIVELSASTTRFSLEDALTGVLENLFEDQLATDAVIAQSGKHRDDIWRCRELIPEGEKRAGGSVKHDISVPLSSIEMFLSRGADIVRAHDPSLRLSVYGHLGDGNIHFNVLVPTEAERISFSRRLEAELSPSIYELARDLGGTFSAEYGIGRLKRSLLERYADPAKMEIMGRIKGVLDPEGRMNPGAVVDFFQPDR